MKKPRLKVPRVPTLVNVSRAKATLCRLVRNHRALPVGITHHGQVVAYLVAARKSS